MTVITTVVVTFIVTVIVTSDCHSHCHSDCHSDYHSACPGCSSQRMLILHHVTTHAYSLQYKRLPPFACKAVSSTASLAATNLVRDQHASGKRAYPKRGTLTANSNLPNALQSSRMACRLIAERHARHAKESSHQTSLELHSIFDFPQMRASVSPPRKSYPPTREFVAGGGQVTCKALAVCLPYDCLNSKVPPSQTSPQRRGRRPEKKLEGTPPNRT